MRKLLIVLMLSAISAALAQNNAGWQHTVGPVFGEPFTDVLLPWPAEAVQLAEIKDCWRDTEPPFLGSEWRFWCYSVLDAGGQYPLPPLDAAFTDAGYGGFLMSTWFPPENGLFGEGTFRRDASRVRVFLFNWNEVTFVGLAANTLNR